MSRRSPAGLVLAAGRSSRMPGRSKLARAWSDTTVLGAVLRSAAEAGLDPLFVTASDDLPPVPAGISFIVVPVSGDRSGRADSLAAGLDAIPEGPVVVMLADEPAVRPADVKALVEAWDETDADMSRIRYTDRPGHPVLLGPAARRAASRLTGEAAVWEALHTTGLRGSELVVSCLAPIDVDNPADLRRARSRAT